MLSSVSLRKNDHIDEIDGEIEGHGALSLFSRDQVSKTFNYFNQKAGMNT
ncbi:hypothetical protein BN1221_00158c [Brenneria goodwinii]|uniref:Uncharacterized protein n=1 Tax=Brenneria goodwinii TaxID=1109412 RepID=A0A0G4JPA1_9GAMM|nr:hypothetical protein BN1221_00158c [Brenneria goodwinii]